MAGPSTVQLYPNYKTQERNIDGVTLAVGSWSLPVLAGSDSRALGPPHPHQCPQPHSHSSELVLAPHGGMDLGNCVGGDPSPRTRFMAPAAPEKNVGFLRDRDRTFSHHPSASFGQGPGGGVSIVLDASDRGRPGRSRQLVGLSLGSSTSWC